MYIKTGSGSGTSSTNWKNITEFYIKTGATVWSRVKQGYIKTSSTVWKRFFNEANLPVQITGPTLRSENTSGTGSIYDGPVATSPQFLNADLFGKDGTYSNYTSITARRLSYADSLDASIRSTLVFDDRFTSAGGVTTANRTALDGKYLFYEIQVNNGTGDDFINPVSSPKKMIKSYPVLTSLGWTGTEAIGTMLTLNYNIENYYYNKIDPDLSYVRWWRSTSTNAGGTLLEEETISATSTGATSTSRTGTSYYTPVAADDGYYIVAEITARSSYTEHYGYTDNYSLGSFPTGGVIGAAIGVSGVSFTDGNDRSGKNARGNLVTATTTNLNWTVTGVNTGTTFRVRYRVLNNQTGLYYNPGNPTTALAAGSAWQVFTDNYNGTGNISSVSISGSTATLYDTFTIDETFNGSTYSGGISRWRFEYEISVLSSSLTRYYWSGGSSVSTSQTHDYWDIDPTTDPSISVSPATIAPGGTATFSGTFNPYPATLSSYPHSYKIVYGTSPATDSGWITLNASPANQTYTNTKVYSTAGTYSAYIETTPYYTVNYATVTVSAVKVPPTIGTPTISATGAFVAGLRRLSVPFTAVTGSGPAYQIFWYPGADYAGAAKPPVSLTIDGSGTTSPIIDESGPTTIGRYAVWIRSSATTSTTGTTAPSTTLSDWSTLANFYISGTRTLSYNKNTTDTVGSLPSDSSGTDPWDGWVTTVSANTPTRTGFTFNGYNTAAAGNGTDYAASAAITLTSDVILYAKWTANTYAITYYDNGGTGSPAAGSKTHGVNFTLSSTTPTRTNYIFDGWNTLANGTGTNYSAGGSYTTNAALDLYAKWIYRNLVTFDLNGGGGTAPTSLRQATAGGSITLPGIGSMTGPAGKPDFGGWLTSSTGTTAVSSPYTPTADTTLYAKWSAAAVVAPGTPSSATWGTHTYAYVANSLSTTLTNAAAGNSTKTQNWTYQARVTFNWSWGTGTNAASYEVYFSSSSTAPTSTTTGDNVGTATSHSFTAVQTGRGTLTRYAWVRSVNSAGNSAWRAAGSTTSTATVVSGLNTAGNLKICRTGTSTCSNAPTTGMNTVLTHTYTSVNTGFSHVAYISNMNIADTTGLSANS